MPLIQWIMLAIDPPATTPPASFSAGGRGPGLRTAKRPYLPKLHRGKSPRDSR